MVVVEFPSFAYDSGSASQKNMQYRDRSAWGEVGRAEHDPKGGLGPSEKIMLVPEAVTGGAGCAPLGWMGAAIRLRPMVGSSKCHRGNRCGRRRATSVCRPCRRRD